MEFIPERFDPESKFFNLKSTQKARPASSFIPFSLGTRKCPGDSYGMTTMKALVAYFITHVEYECDYVDDPTCYLGMDGSDSLPGKILKKIG